MNIVLEGPDNAGKSTLAKKLSEALGMPIRHSGGPSKYKGEVNERAKSFIADETSYIYDRHPCVSQNIYVCALGTGGELVEQETVKAFYETNPLIIYCRSDGSLVGHEQSEHSTQEYFNEVEKNYVALCTLYDTWGLKNAKILYRIGDSVPALLQILGRLMMAQRLTNLQYDIQLFHEKFGNEYNGPPRELSAHLSHFRRKFLNEELSEYESAVEAGDLEKQFDALLDLVYVAIGTAYLQGFPFNCGWALVHEANMKKVRATNVSQSTRASLFDVVKPQGWVAPDLKPLLQHFTEERANEKTVD